MGRRDRHPPELDWGGAPFLEATRTRCRWPRAIVKHLGPGRGPGPVAESFHRIDKGVSPTGSSLGIGVGPSRGAHPSTRSPTTRSTEYLDKLDEYGPCPKDRRVVAALGNRRCSSWSAPTQAQGAPPVPDPRLSTTPRRRANHHWTWTPFHRPRAQGGAHHRLADQAAGPSARKALDMYLGLANYLKQLQAARGSPMRTWPSPGSDRFIDAVRRLRHRRRHPPAAPGPSISPRAPTHVARSRC